MLEDARKKLPSLRADAARALGIVTYRFAGPVPEADMDMQPIADRSGRHARAETHRMAVPPSGAARHLAQDHGLVAGRERLFGWERYLELLLAELGEVGIGLDPASGQGGKESLAKAAMTAHAVESIVVADTASGAGIEKLMLERDRQHDAGLAPEI